MTAIRLLGAAVLAGAALARDCDDDGDCRGGDVCVADVQTCMLMGEDDVEDACMDPDSEEAKRAAKICAMKHHRGTRSSRIPRDSYPSSVAAASASFTDNEKGLSGYVKIRPFEVEVELNEDGFDWGFIGMDCAEGGLKYHVHDGWPEGETGVLYGADCGAANTGGHYDPTLGCGPASGNALCKSKGGCVREDTGTYSCTPAGFAEDPTTCEVSDYSGKFGRYPINERKVYSDPFGFAPANLEGKSLVFHCGGGARAICAKLEMVAAERDLVYPVTYRPPTERYQVDFGEANLAGGVYITGNHFEIKLDLSNHVDALKNINPDCLASPGLKYHIHESFSPGNKAYDRVSAHFYQDGGEELCGAASTGGHWDPTIACSGASHSPLCMNRGMENSCVYSSSAMGTDNVYDCSLNSNPFSCEVSDTSSRFGRLMADENNRIHTSFVDPMFPVTNLEGRSVVVHCGTGERAFCGKITKGCGSTRRSKGRGRVKLVGADMFMQDACDCRAACKDMLSQEASYFRFLTKDAWKRKGGKCKCYREFKYMKPHAHKANGRYVAGTV